jgi:hypothetical protein
VVDRFTVEAIYEASNIDCACDVFAEATAELDAAARKDERAKLLAQLQAWAEGYDVLTMPLVDEEVGVILQVHLFRLLERLRKETAVCVPAREPPPWVSNLAALMAREASAHPADSAASAVLRTFRACLLEMGKGGAHG